MTAKPKANITDLKPRITVIGVGGAGCNAINNMIDANLDGVDFVVANTDAQSLVASNAPIKIQLGARLTEGLGAGSRPDIGEAAAEETIDELRDLVRGSHMVFVAAGMGGGTGTGAAAVIARAAKEQNILTVAVVTKPFQFEGARRMRIAEAGIAELKKHVDTLIVIPNQNLFRIASERTTFAEAFVLADQVLYSGVACIVDLIVKEGLINLDFADVRTVMSGMGSAMMGTGEATGENRAVRAAEEAITNPLLDDVTLEGAKGLLLSITGGSNLTLHEVDEAATRVRQEVDPEANIIVGATFDPSLGDRVRVSVVASGMDRAAPAMLTQQRQSMTGRAGGQTPPPLPSASDNGVGATALAQALREITSPSFETLARQAGEPQRPDLVGHGGHGSTPSSWHANDEIDITDLSPAALARQYAPPMDYAPAPANPPPDQFAPAPPTQIRRPPRRMPELEEFPAVGQREYHAKRSREAAQAGTQRNDSEPRKRGLFERLAGLGKRTTDSRPEHRAPHSPQASRSQNGDHSYSVGAAAGGHRDASPSEQSKRQEKPEFPAFFNRARR